MLRERGQDRITAQLSAIAQQLPQFQHPDPALKPRMHEQGIGYQGLPVEIGITANIKCSNVGTYTHALAVAETTGPHNAPDVV